MEESIGGLTQEQVEKLKKQHGPLTLITVGEDSEELHFFFRKPDMNTMRAVGSQAERDPIGAAQIYFKNCLVHGDKSYVDDVEVFTSIAPYLQELIKEKKVVLKNL